MLSAAASLVRSGISGLRSLMGNQVMFCYYIGNRVLEQAIGETTHIIYTHYGIIVSKGQHLLFISFLSGGREFISVGDANKALV